MHRIFTVALLLPIAIAIAAPADAKDLKSMTADEIRQLQHRLTDAGCYSGAIDGKASTDTETAKAACPDQEPVLRIETGMHTAVLRGMGVDAECTLAATASYDKTVRIWSLPDGKLQQILRLPVAGINGGKVFATAMSPDGRYVAAGGWDSKPGNDGIYLTDLATGNVRHVGSFENVVNRLAFSPDGSKIALVLGEKGLRVLDRATGSELMADRDYSDDAYGVAWGSDGSLYGTSYDGFVRRYSPELKRTAKVKAPDGKRPFGIAVNGASNKVAIGYDDSTAVSILRASDLKAQAKGETGDMKSGDLTKVVWGRDGRLWAGGRALEYTDNKWSIAVRALSAAGKHLGQDVMASNDTIGDLKACGDGIAFAAGDPSFGIIARDGKVTTLQGPVTVDMRDKLGPAFTIAPDGATVRFGLEDRGEKPVIFDLLAGTVSDSPTAPAGMHEARIDGFPVTDWQNTYDAKYDGKRIDLDDHEVSESIAVQPDKSGFVLGTNFSLAAFDGKGKDFWRNPVPGIAWGVNFARNGKLLVVAHGDGTIRWYRWSDGKELLAFFLHVPTRKWVAWTPSGYYMASPGAEDMIGWHINRGWEQPPDFFPASRFRDKFSRPDIVQKVLFTLDETKAIEEANQSGKRKPDEVKPIEQQLPPVIRIMSPGTGGHFTGNQVTLDYELRSPSGLAVTGIDVLIDGRPIVAKGVGRADPTLGTGKLTVDLPAKDVDVALIARAGDKSSEANQIHLVFDKPAAAAADVPKPNLYVLAVGVADYVDPSLRLGLSGKDAVDFSSAMQEQEGGLYQRVTVKKLIDRDATHDSVLDGLDWLEHQVTSRDVGVIFLSGHGMIDDGGRFWYVPSDATLQRIRSRGISKDDIRATLGRLAGKAILFLDACHAAGVSKGEQTRGEVDVNSVVNELSSSENGIVVYGSSTGRELSLENSDWGNGAFTKAVVEGIRDGKADTLSKGTITLSGLDYYIAERVKDLTGGRQHPIMTKPGTISNYTIALPPQAVKQ